jgi:hypothetical protein
MHKHLSESHSRSLPIGVEFPGLLKCLGCSRQLAFCKQQVAAHLVCDCKLRKDGQRALDSCVRLRESLQLYQRTGRQAQEIGILRVLLQQDGADSFRRFDLASLQKRQCLLKLFLVCYFIGN